MEHSFLVLRELRCGLGWLRVGNLNARYLSHFYQFCAEDLTDPKEANGTFTDISISIFGNFDVDLDGSASII